MPEEDNVAQESLETALAGYQPAQTGEDNNQPVENPATPVEPQIPDEYQGKTLEELIKMHQDSQEFIKKQSKEVGESRAKVDEIRQVADELIKRQLHEPLTSTRVEEVEDDETGLDFILDPENAIKHALQDMPEFQQLTSFAENQKRQAATNAVLEAHPDMQEVVTSPEFEEWVKASPQRQQLFKEAGENYLPDLGIELLNYFKAMTNYQSTKPNDTDQADEALVNGATPAGNGVSSGAGNSSSKVFSRKALMTLMNDDPDTYARLSPEITKAYAEGRVVD